MIPWPVRVRPLNDKTKPSETKSFVKIYPHHSLYYIPLLKRQKELICGAKIVEGPEAPEDLQ